MKFPPGGWLTAGFTLVEILLAVAILALVLVVAGTGLAAVRRSWEKCRSNSERLTRLILIDKVVESNFRNIIPFEWRDENRKKREVFLGDPDRVIFASAHAVNTVAEGGVRFMVLRLDGGRLLAEYGDTPILYWDSKTVPKRVEVLTRDVTELKFTYADFDSDGNLIWDSDWDEKERRNIPVALQMVITWKDGRVARWLRRTAGAGNDESYGRRSNERR
ncbi:MAG: prepilin-type N-terminal cleavage/methylation domain-containing protein [Kiritimatiellaeota bacterium]|nr:prepilin-type N-terminal cleavage/methylation domain-containing protein [Kiritimatiellota bacterium]